ncbi:MAG: 3'-5' exonuclease [Acidobacteriota bacterium]|nr:3'-5' exonuclease [Acidobacteriota bacterium]
MAEMIPDRLPAGCSIGEKRLFDILQMLPEDCIVYYEPVVSNRYPDFVVILPDQGLLVIEVKGWLPYQILGADSDNVTIKEGDETHVCTHPVRQARQYMYALMDKCRRHGEYSCLVHQEGAKKGKFIFPFGHCAILTRMTSEQLRSHPLGDLGAIFDGGQIQTSETIKKWAELTAIDLKKVFGNLFNPKWHFTPLNKKQINVLREVLHPEIRISPPPADLIHEHDKSDEIKVIDLEQEKAARSIGDGHRIIHGVAGSGKTVLLIARAKLLTQDDPNKRILMLTYNIALAAYLKRVLSGYPNISISHFHSWAAANGIFFDGRETEEEFGNRLLENLSRGRGEAGFYDAALIDEAQDFAPVWFKAVLAAMKEPADGDLLIVGDASQGLYPHGRISWRKLGIQAQGRTKRLERNYRNTPEILKAASCVAPSPRHYDPDALSADTTDPNKSLRAPGLQPLLLYASDRENECKKVLSIVSNLIRGKWENQSIKPLRPEDIGILYPRKQLRWIFDPFLEGLNEIAPVVWLTEPQNRENKSRVCEPGIKVQTIHSAKGLQYKAVILMFMQEILYGVPAYGPERDEKLEEARRLLYVALTRAEDYLAVSCSGESIFAKEMVMSGYFKNY